MAVAACLDLVTARHEGSTAWQAGGVIISGDNIDLERYAALSVH